jgi:hypothetical protein
MTHPRRLGLGVLLLASACVDIEVQRIGADHPSRPPGCAVEVIPGGKPGYDFVDVASANVSCARKRDRCLDELRKQACVVGADAVYGFSEKTESMYLHINARFAARAPGVK